MFGIVGGTLLGGRGTMNIIGVCLIPFICFGGMMLGIVDGTRDFPTARGSLILFVCSGGVMCGIVGGTLEGMSSVSPSIVVTVILCAGSCAEINGIVGRSLLDISSVSGNTVIALILCADSGVMMSG